MLGETLSPERVLNGVNILTTNIFAHKEIDPPLPILTAGSQIGLLKT